MKSPHHIKHSYVEIAGWIGVGLILLGYVLLSTGIVAGRSIPYQAMILFGSGGIAFEAWSKRDKQPMVLNLIFTAIACITLIQLFVKQ